MLLNKETSGGICCNDSLVCVMALNTYPLILKNLFVDNKDGMGRHGHVPAWALRTIVHMCGVLSGG